ncbi:MAG TPA: bifunctional phosphopantothenoylcysteine decarboxylase/phosphopantothenate--cysteine ligase CoaBC [Erysipelotrichaceae bacterium]|nr:bifunctional phosphopantothenoylcysteine decarboxylase/phosphopantothenate--cysteine ligase CoaBC [Erysipelotrichaceae bacterium]
MKKTIVIGVTGGIAAFKVAQLVSNLKKKGYEIHVIMTESATKFVHPITFETLSNNRVSIDTFDRNFQYDVEHISLAKKADLFVVAPATANVIGKIANGIADDMLTTTIMACTCPKIICPAMNTNMLNNPITQDNINKLKGYGYHFVDSGDGFLACGDVGSGRLANLDIIEDEIEIVLSKKPLLNKKILISAGPTIEAIDPVRYITNHSSGKMGYSLAIAARNLGADVTLVSGKTSLKKPHKVNVIDIVSADDMFKEITSISEKFDVIIMSAAVADYRPKNVSDSKIKKSLDMSIELERTKDILEHLGKNKKENQVLIGFAMETEDLIENAKVKLEKKNADYIIANNLNEKGAGFKVDTNKVTIISKNENKEIDLMDKSDLAYLILDYCLKGGE